MGNMFSKRKREVRENNPRFLIAKATQKPIPSLATRRSLKKTQRKARQIRRAHG